MRSPISETEMLVLIDEQIARLDNLTRPTWKKYRTPLEEFESPGGEAPARPRLFILARAGSEIIYFDDQRDEFGAGEIDSSGAFRDYGTYGSELRGTLRHFPRKTDRDVQRE